MGARQASTFRAVNHVIKTVPLGNRLGLFSSPCGSKLSKEGHNNRTGKNEDAELPKLLHRFLDITCQQRSGARPSRVAMQSWVLLPQVILNRSL